jgi:glycosyltransferase involved in cell wall biosynthesis
MNEQHPHRAAIAPLPEGTPRPLWSVMIPTYNCANYLRETLASVLAQDPGPEIMQIEVVDDHSTKDDPEAVVRELAGDRVSFYRQPENVGYIKNFNTCLQRSRGQWIHLLHGDDYVLDGFYCKVQQLFEKHPQIGAAFCRYIYMDQQGHWEKIQPLEQTESGVLNNWLERIASGQRLTTPSIVVQREVYEKFGGFDNRFSCTGEDWEMWVRIATQYSVGYEVKPLAAYRTFTTGSLTQNSIRSGKFFQDLRLANEIVQSYLPHYMQKTTASKVSKQAREIFAFIAIQHAYHLLNTGNVKHLIILMKESLKCSYSLRVIKRIIHLVVELGQYKCKQTLTRYWEHPVLTE